MIEVNKFEVARAISNSNGIGELAFRDHKGRMVRLPVSMTDVTMRDHCTVTCDVMGINPLKSEYGMDVPRLYPQTVEYIKNDVLNTIGIHEMFECKTKSSSVTPKLPRIKNVIHSAPATIVFWMDGTKTVVKAVNEEYDPEKGIAMAFVKKMFGNKGNYFNNIKKWLPEKTEAKAEQDAEKTEEEA